MSIIKARDLQKTYNGTVVLNLPELSIRQGESFGLVGNNGAGKTTFFSLILDLIEASNGEVLSGDKNVKQSEHWKSYTGAYLDEQFLIDFLSPEEYFEFIAGLNRMDEADYKSFIDRFSDFFNGEIMDKNKYIRDLSRGNQKKVGIAAALMGQPDVLVLDEPFPHLDPTTVIRLKEILLDFNKGQETTMLISSHNLNHITEICDRIVLLEKGLVLRDLPCDKNTLSELEDYFSTTT